MADVATTAVQSEASAPSTPVVVKKTSSKKGRKAASAPKSPAAKTAKNTAAAKPKIPRVKAPTDHPTYLLMVTEAISALKDRKGASSQAIYKHISSQYNLVKEGTSEKMVRNRFGAALKKGVSTGVISQTSGIGANGRFRIMAAKAKKTASPSSEAPSAPATPSTPAKSKTIKKVKKSASAPSPSEKKKSPKKVAVKPIAKKGKKTASKKATA